MAITTRPRPGRSDGRRARIALAGGGVAALLTVTHTAVDAMMSMLAALLPTLQERFGSSEATLAGLVAALWIGTSMAQPLFGIAADRYGTRRVAAAGVIVNAVLLSFMAVAPNPAVLFALLFVGGLGSAAFHPAAISMARKAGGERPGVAVSIVTAGGTFGLALGPAAVIAVITSLGVGFTPWLMLPGIALGLGMLRYLPAHRSGSAPESTVAPRFDWRLVRGPVGALSGTVLLSSLATVAFTSSLPLYLVNVRGASTDAAVIGWSLGVFNGSAALGGIAGGVLASKVRPSLLVPASMSAALPALLAVFAFESGTAPFYIAVAAAGALSNAALPAMILTAQDLAPEAVATASAMLMGFAVGTAGVLYVGVGFLQQIIGIAPAMGISYLTLVPAALMANRVLARHAPAAAQAPGPNVSRCSCSACACVPCAIPAPAAA